MTSSERLMEIAERLAELDPVRTYPERGAGLIAGLVGAAAYRLDRADREGLNSESTLTNTEPTISLPLRQGRQQVGILHLEIVGDAPAGNQLELLKWASRLYARGLDYVDRLADEGGRRPGEAVEQTLRRAPLTPRERDVVSLLVAGSSTRDIASETGLTVSTVNTYLKRIFSKLGVHSRVELIARMAGTATIPPRSSYEAPPHAD
ncbi:MAG: LuxR C-terminal-related transcriptional regulator [Myxococcales bacterium]|nr:LuxR C-terminal-related transcriptional regulator [Myxococcales bacterium]MDH3845882.1 LuxR C-terminal-related transcriptional regulator [Myxococcales bacterium]